MTYDNNGFYEFTSPNLMPSYSLLHLGTRIKLNEQLEFYARVNNLLDESYEPANGFEGGGGTCLLA